MRKSQSSIPETVFHAAGIETSCQFVRSLFEEFNNDFADDVAATLTLAAVLDHRLFAVERSLDSIGEQLDASEEAK